MAQQTTEKLPLCPECHASQTGKAAEDSALKEHEEIDEINPTARDSVDRYHCHHCGFEWGDNTPPVTTFPIYILDFEGHIQIVFRANRMVADLIDLWSFDMRRVLTQRFGFFIFDIHPADLKLQHSLRHARVQGDKVFYGEEPDSQILMAIRSALKKPTLEFVHDECEQRRPEEVKKLEELIKAIMDVPSRPVGKPLPRRSPPCPKCHTDKTAVIQYGKPSFLTDQLLDEEAQGIIEFGGCIVEDDAPLYRCHGCRHRWGSNGPPYPIVQR